MNYRIINLSFLKDTTSKFCNNVAGLTWKGSYINLFSRWVFLFHETFLHGIEWDTCHNNYSFWYRAFIFKLTVYTSRFICKVCSYVCICIYIYFFYSIIYRKLTKNKLNCVLNITPSKQFCNYYGLPSSTNSLMLT